MFDNKYKRAFSSTTHSRNYRLLSSNTAPKQPVEVGFILLENFSMMAFTAAVDTLITANLVRAIREILSCDQIAESNGTMKLQTGDNPSHPESLRTLKELMGNNIEEPLPMEELASLVCVSLRQVERLFQTHLDTSPSSYYLELRITHAQRLLVQTNESIINISLASGFVTSGHFSNCFKDYFGISPSYARQKQSCLRQPQTKAEK